jgi:hypothetical protein
MDRLATGIAIAATALLMSGGLMRDAAAATADSKPSQVPAVQCSSGERVMSLILTLEALRTAPALLDARKV